MWNFFTKKALPLVTFATSCYEKDWKEILLNPEYLKKKQIENHLFPFAKKYLIINNVKDEKEVARVAEEKKKEGIITDYYIVSELQKEVMSFFSLERASFVTDGGFGATNDWVYYNAIGVLTAIYLCKTDYFLYLTGDVYLPKPFDWITPSLQRMEKKEQYKVANPVWNYKYSEAKKESYKEEKDFYIAKEGFSDQMFLMRREDIQKPIYGEIRADSSHFPRGDVFEKRVYSYMKNHNWKRIIYKHASYMHENF